MGDACRAEVSEGATVATGGCPDLCRFLYCEESVKAAFMDEVVAKVIVRS